MFLFDLVFGNCTLGDDSYQLVNCSIVMLSATKHLDSANEILRFAQDDKGGLIGKHAREKLRFMHLRADGSAPTFIFRCFLS